VDRDFASLADRMVMLSKGAVVFDGTPAALAAQPELLERHLGV
jgi:branched-chain amino acid transport system ATP-binding protein